MPVGRTMLNVAVLSILCTFIIVLKIVLSTFNKVYRVLSTAKY